MRIGRSARWLDDLSALWGAGAVASSSDADLLEQFARRRDDASEVAFEVLVVRHGPMVLGTCRRVLRDRQDVEDAFQATFLVLARKAGSLRVRDSLGPWLHEVARRVSLEARAIAGRRRAREDPNADPSAIPGREAGGGDLREVVDEELRRLPEGFRKAVVLCDLEDLTIEEAARHLGWPAGTVRSRLARGRERLRDRLTRRGLAPSSGMVPVVGAAPAPLPGSLIKAAIGCATNRAGAGAAPTAASILAEGVLMSMIQGKVRMTLVAAALLGAIGAASLSALAQRPQAPDPKAARVPAEVSGPTPAAEHPAAKPADGYRMVGSVRVEGSGEPVPGARVDVLIGDSGADKIRAASTGPDGRFLLDLPPGQANAWTFFPPPGYWAPRNTKSIENFVLSPADPVHRKDYLVRRGIVWPFRVAIGAGGRLMRGGYVGASRRPDDVFKAEADDAGLARLTLPAEGGKITVGISEGPGSANFVQVPIEWASGFRPEGVKSIDRKAGSYHLADEDGRVATIGESAGVEPTIVEAKLLIRVTLLEADPGSVRDLSGRVVEAEGRPLEGANVALTFREKAGSGMSSDEKHRATTDAQGRYVLRSVPLRDPVGGPVNVAVVVTKEGYAGVDSPPFPIQPGEKGVPQAVGDVTLEKGVSLSGTVVTPDGRPAIGAWVSASDSYALRSQFTRTDENGRFTVRNLPRGMVRLSFNLGSLGEGSKYLADGTDDELKIRLRTFPAAAARAATPPSRPSPPAIGQRAPELKVVGWTDGQARSLADYRGKVVYLDFWGMWCSPCVQEIPSLEQFRQKYGPRGLVILSVHTPGEELERIRRLFEFKKVSLLSALDERRKESDNPLSGETAERYGIYGYPTMVLIDREGKVAWHGAHDVKEKVAAMKALGKEMGLDESSMTPEQFETLRVAWFGREIEKVLGRP